MIVYSVIKRFKLRGTVQGHKSIGRQRKWSERSIRVVTRTLKTDRRQTLADITNRCGLNVGTSIIRQALHQVGFYNQVVQKSHS